MSTIRYYFVYGITYLTALLPFGLLYLLSDLAYLFAYHIGYRRKVVRENIARSFPAKSKHERGTIERKFYHYLCDSLFEDIKMMHLSEAEMRKRMRYPNMDLYLKLLADHGGLIVMMPHYGHFEWLISTALYMDKEDIPMQVYRPLKDKQLDTLFKDIRSKWGGQSVAKNDTLRALLTFRSAGKRVVLGLVSDQSPNRAGLHFWTTFLNQETSFLMGAERIAKKVNYPVVYAEINRIKRGYGETTFHILAQHPNQTAPFEITEAFARALEQTIERNPPYWLWSHKRWKHQREQHD